MVDEKMNVANERKDAAKKTPAQGEDAGEYGLEQLLNQNEADLEEVRKRSSYHYTHDQLQHKEDRVGGKQT